MTVPATHTQPVRTKTPLTTNQKKGFIAAYAGWTLDGMDAFIYGLVLVPALRELLPMSGIQATQVNIGIWGSILFAMFLAGWGLSMFWGMIGDRIGRVRALALTIVAYSIFTLMCGLVTSVYQLAILRILCGFGLGGEQPVGSTFVAESLPEDRRVKFAGYLHTGYYVGFLLASIANYTIGANFGWRWMFAFGGLPALFVGWIMSNVKESHRFEEMKKTKKPSIAQAFGGLFTSKYKNRTIVMSLVYLVSIIGQWAGSIYVPTAITQIAMREGAVAADAARIASWGGAVLAIGTVLGCLCAPILAEKYGRRVAMAIFMSLLTVTTAVAFGWAFFIMGPNALPVFFAMTFFLGLAGANFAMYTLWLPELFETSSRGSGMGFISSIGRFAGVGMVFLIAAGVNHFGNIGTPIALTSFVLFAGLFLLPFTVETKGQPLPR
ncbi:MAG TPA: MFS transporter [Vicinamibacterales bacterium]|nr:MFS transporter [Vicinamibacterales bacterium]